MIDFTYINFGSPMHRGMEESDVGSSTRARTCLGYGTLADRVSRATEARFGLWAEDANDRSPLGGTVPILMSAPFDATVQIQCCERLNQVAYVMDCRISHQHQNSCVARYFSIWSLLKCLVFH